LDAFGAMFKDNRRALFDFDRPARGVVFFTGHGMEIGRENRVILKDALLPMRRTGQSANFQSEKKWPFHT
jgi:hypothetical protein